MPEYLAPGVYVEETSFRAKSIEGVSTSTTAFVGPTLRGPLAPASETARPETPELLTSFGDFQRIFGGFGDLRLGGGQPSTNYLAHAVRAYFDNGGGRLYVSRVTGAGAVAAASAPSGVRFVARTAGSGGNGTVTVVPHYADATKRSMDRAAQGTTLRLNGKNAATPARLTGTTTAPFFLPRTGKLTLQVNGGASVDVTLNGAPAEAVAPTAIAAATVAFPDAAARSFQVVIDEVPQVVEMPASIARADVAAHVNAALVGGYARLGSDNKLVIGSDVHGNASKVDVPTGGANTILGFSAAVPAVGTGDLPNVRRVTVAQLATRLGAIPSLATSIDVTSDGGGHLVLVTKQAGTNRSIQVVGGAGSVHGIVGFGADGGNNSGATGGGGQPLEFYVKDGSNWVGDSGTLALGGLGDTDPPSPDGADFVTVSVVSEDASGVTRGFDELGLAPQHPRYIGTVLAQTPSRRAEQLDNGYAFEVGGAAVGAVRNALLATGGAIRFTVSGGVDGAAPTQVDYEAGLRQLGAVEDISIVAAPGSSTYPQHAGIQGALISHCERRRAYRIAVLDTAPGILVSEAREERARIDSTYAALYYPWVVVANPLARTGDESIPREIALPPSGFVAGVYARTDVTRGVFKAPANEVVRGALRYDVDVNFAQQEVLNPLGVNCLRFFPGRGNRVWGARTTSSDPEWKYVNVRRYFSYLERSIDIGTQWAVFEPNGERLWSNIRDTVGDFLTNEWRSGALLGSSPREAFFVRCDRSTMDQNDLDNGRLVCLVGLAVVKPAEFVIFRIGQKTADARS